MPRGRNRPRNRRRHGLGNDAHAGVSNGNRRPALLGTAAPDVYGDQFTLDDVLAPVYGLEPSQILTEFAALEFYVMERVNKSVETITVNFTKEA